MIDNEMINCIWFDWQQVKKFYENQNLSRMMTTAF